MPAERGGVEDHRGMREKPAGGGPPRELKWVASPPDVDARPPPAQTPGRRQEEEQQGAQGSPHTDPARGTPDPYGSGL